MNLQIFENINTTRVLQHQIIPKVLHVDTCMTELTLLRIVHNLMIHLL
jgi:hypothetical protein